MMKAFSSLENVVQAISEDNVDSCYGDLIYVDKNNTDKVIRYWNAGNFNKERFKLNLIFAIILLSQVSMIVVGQWLRTKNWIFQFPW